MTDMSRADAAIAANRFGLGAAPGELQDYGGQAREALRQQLQGGAPMLPEALPASQALLAEAMAQRAAASENTEPAAVAAASVRPLREVYQPAYVADVLARFRAAATSRRSFVERLVHFWSNHFAVSVDKLVVLGLAGPMEREAVRPHVLGNFADLLLAVEQHPAMLLYLDNQQSIGAHSDAAQKAGRRGRELGLNENLGREILELHTLGVGAGYTQQDVRSLANMITGWSIGGESGRLRGGEPGAFYFRETFHEPGAAILLGQRYADAGVEQGRAALRALAVHPATARHLATKLARHFIADEPPPAAVARIAAAFLASGGDLPATYGALLDSPESWAEPTSKFKSPADYIHSVWRGLELPVGSAQRDLRIFEELGQRIFQPRSPAGWPDRGADWDGSAALLKRLEWAQDLSARTPTRPDRLAADMLGESLSDHTRSAIARAADPAQALTLLLCSPDFLRR